MNRYDNESLRVLAQRGPIGGRLIRGLLWAVILIFLASIVVFFLFVFPQPEGIALRQLVSEVLS